MLISCNLLKGKSRQVGFSLVELMVSIVIGLIILAGVVQVVFTSKATFLAQEDMSYIQENARFALSVIGKDIRGAGYWGCARTSVKSALVLDVDDGDATTLTSMEGIVGYEESSTVKFPADTASYTRWPPTAFETATTRAHNTESFIVRYAGGKPLTVSRHESARFFIKLEGNEPIANGDILAVTSRDCETIGVFNAVGAANLILPGTDITEHTVSYVTGGASLNCTTKIKLGPTDASITCPASVSGGSPSYFPGATAMKYVSRGYFIEESAVLPGQPALKRAVLNKTGGTDEEEIALGVEDMLILYGVDTGAGIQLKKAAAVATANEWSKVTSVQINLVFRSQSQSLSEPSTKTYLGNTYGDKYLRQVVTATFKLRNRI